MLSSTKKKILHGSATNLLQMMLSFSVSLIVPPFLVHHMPQAEYSAWVLILQISAYINYLEIGIQTAIGKFVAEYHAAGDTVASARVASTAFSILSIAGAVGVVAMGALAYAVPSLFHQMPRALVPEMRIGILAIGSTTAVLLPFLVLQAVFIGLQRYAIPAIITSVGRVGSSLAIIALLLLHGSLAQMALLVAAFNILTAAAQWYCWKRFASREVPLQLLVLDRGVALRLLEYCGILAIWTIGSLFVSGLDTTIVGRYDFRNTGFYAVAASATNFMLLIVGNVMGPLMPAVSALQGQRSSAQLGDLLVRSTRYCTLLICALALPLLIGGFPLLRLWLGSVYAVGSVSFLAILVVANAVRQLGYPYAMMVVATGTQRSVILAPVLEACLNFTVSVALVRSMGAAGVALGTLIGAAAALTTHLLVSIPRTMRVIEVNRVRLVLQGMVRPALCALPTVLLLPWWHSRAVLPFSPALLIAWALTTAVLAWMCGLTLAERESTLHRLRAAILKPALHKGHCAPPCLPHLCTRLLLPWQLRSRHRLSPSRCYIRGLSPPANRSPHCCAFLRYNRHSLLTSS